MNLPSQLLSSLEKTGISAGLVPNSAVQIEPSFREACAANRCLHYGKSWSCPPAIGELKTLEARLRSFPQGLVLKTVWPVADEFDLTGMLAAAKKHDRLLLDALPGLLAALSATRHLLLGAGPCPLCERCAYPAAPCRHPDRRLDSLEACAIDVTRLAAAARLSYLSAPKTVSYFGLLCFSSR